MNTPFATQQAMRDYVTSLGASLFRGNAEQVEEIMPGVWHMRQKLFEFHHTTALEAEYDFYLADNGNCWFRAHEYARSAPRIRPTHHTR